MSKKVTPKSLRKHADWLEERGNKETARKMRGWAYAMESGREYWEKWSDIPPGVQFIPSQFPDDLWEAFTTTGYFKTAARSIRIASGSDRMLDAQGPFVRAES